MPLKLKYTSKVKDGKLDNCTLTKCGESNVLIDILYPDSLEDEIYKTI